MWVETKQNKNPFTLILLNKHVCEIAHIIVVLFDVTINVCVPLLSIYVTSEGKWQ